MHRAGSLYICNPSGSDLSPRHAGVRCPTGLLKALYILDALRLCAPSREHGEGPANFKYYDV